MSTDASGAEATALDALADACRRFDPSWEAGVLLADDYLDGLPEPEGEYELLCGRANASPPQPEPTTVHELLGQDLRALSPGREPQSYVGQKNRPNWFSSTTTGSMLFLESLTEATHALALDFDPSVSWIVPQGLGVRVPRARGQGSEHWVDFVVERQGKPTLLIDVAGRALPTAAGTRRGLGAMRHAAKRLRWDFAVAFGRVDRTRLWNLEALRLARGRLALPAGMLETARRTIVAPRRIADVEAELGQPMFARPALLHLLWHRELLADLGKPMETSSVVVPTRVP